VKNKPDFKSRSRLRTCASTSLELDVNKRVTNYTVSCSKAVFLHLIIIFSGMQFLTLS